MNLCHAAFICAAVVAIGPGFAGELRQDYFRATQPGAWSQYDLTTKDGTASVYSYERKPDDAGRVVLELEVKTTAGAGAGSESTMTYTMPKDFVLAKNGLNYGKFTEQMTMQYGDMVMPVDANTLEIIRGAEKDYRGKLTFSGTETIQGLACDRYTYALNGAGPVPTKESGTLWLNDAVPFAIVRHAGKVVNLDGTVASDFDMVLKDRGQIVMTPEEPAVAPTPEAPPAPAVVTLAEGFKAGRVGFELKALAAGRQLSVALRNETEAELTVNVPAGAHDYFADFPLDTLKFKVGKALRLVIPAGETADPFVVDQRGPRGLVEGACTLSTYEDKPIFMGSATMGNLPK